MAPDGALAHTRPGLLIARCNLREPEHSEHIARAPAGSAPRGNPPPVTVQVIREAIRHHIAVTSLRRVAADIGLSPSTLHTVLNEAYKTPHRRTSQKLVTWYLRTGEAGGEATSDRVAESLDVLTRHFPTKQRRRVQRRLIALIQELGRDDVSAPRWLRDLTRKRR